MTAALAEAVDGTRLYYESAGDGPPLLLLSGQANSHSWWDPVVDDFEESHTVITWDYRGTGASDVGDPDAYSTELFASDAIAVLDAADARTAAVYGTSMGGKVAQWVAIQYPHRVQALVLGCTILGRSRQVDSSSAVRQAMRGYESDPAAREFVAELMYTPGFIESGKASMKALSGPMDPAARRGHLLASLRHDAAPAVGDLTCPTLILHGTDDELAPPENAEILHAAIQGSTLMLIPRARHAYFEEMRDLATPAVLEFLRVH